MKSLDSNKNLSCCIIIKQRVCYEHGDGCKEPDYAIGWILHVAKFDLEACKRINDALEDMGFNNGLAKRV